MTESVYVNVDRSKVVKEGSPEAAYRIHTAEAKRLGLLKDAPKATKVTSDQTTEEQVAPKRTTRRSTKTTK